MKVAYCPYCQNVNPLDDRDWGLMVQCEGPRCERFFPTGPLAAAPPEVAPAPAVAPAAPFRFGPPARPAAPPPPPAPPRLTAPHRCQVCYPESEPRELGEMNQPFARRRCTVLHRNPRRADNCRTDIYAALYHCPGCRALLETPSHQWGEVVTCPAESCHQAFIAPRDDVLHRHEGDAREGVAFSFACPAGCGATLTCDTMRESQVTTGLRVVCTQCRHIIAIPGSGVQVGTTPAAVDPVQAVQQVADKPCPKCGNIVPANASPCPMCG